MFVRFGGLERIITLILTLLSIIYLFRCFKYLSSSTSNNYPRASIIVYNETMQTIDKNSSNGALSILCSDMEFYLENELNLPKSAVIYAPSLNSKQLYLFPYRYAQWQSSSIIPRLLTPCEHHLAMHLLMMIDRICRQNQIIYFIIYGTLMGSLRHHDIIPWDDDIDVIVSYDQRNIFSEAFEALNQTLIELYIAKQADERRTEYKLFYKSAGNAGKYPWRFPFVDMFFFEKNHTHLWDVDGNATQIKSENIFPLVLRPLGQLWMPAPRKGRNLFSFNIFDKCVGHYWNHRKEIGIKQLRSKCDNLKDSYPFVQLDNQTNSVEILKINNTIVHTIMFK